MRRYNWIRYSLAALLAALVLGISGFRMVLHPVAPSPAAGLEAQFARQIAALSDLSAQMEALTAAPAPNAATLADARSLLIRMRMLYKTVEHLAAYLDGELVKDHINGAPLPKIERNMPSNLTVLPPAGLQALDDGLFGGDDPAQVQELHSTAVKFRIQAAAWAQHVGQRRALTDRMVLESLRAQVLRIFTLGLTGFDTPGSGNAIPEAVVSLRSMREALAGYRSWLTPASAPVFARTDSLLEAAAGYLEAHPSFDRLNRLHLLRAYFNPLYSSLLDLHLALQLELPRETSPFPRALRYEARDLFSPDLLDPAYYARFPQSPRAPQQIELGRILFFDPVLSSNSERACASCHIPAKGFADGRAKSLALNFEGSLDRNAPTVLNSTYAMRYFHDLRSEELGSQVEHVIVSEQEFNTTYWAIFDKLYASGEYVRLFREAFPEHGAKPINRHTLTTALSGYLQSLTGWNSPFDRYARGETQEIDPAVVRGFNLFMGKAACGTCHFAPVFNGTVPPDYEDSESEVLGVPAAPVWKDAAIDPDMGRIANRRAAEHAPFNQYAFKTPTLRNIALTAPYMHNGVYQTLEEVMQFYNVGGGAGIGIVLPNQTLPPDPLGLSKREIRDIIVFMEALTDTAGLTRAPARLPAYPEGSPLNGRVSGGVY
jgi:cytochrome c peroxidase